MKKRLLLFVFTIVLLASCSPAASTDIGQPGYENISVATLETMINERRDTFLLVNTHIPFAGDIPGTDLSIPYNEILGNLDLLPADKDAEIVLYCRSDSMSHAAAEDLAEAGYTNVKNLVGGFNAWKDAGLPMDMEP